MVCGYNAKKNRNTGGNSYYRRFHNLSGRYVIPIIHWANKYYVIQSLVSEF